MDFKLPQQSIIYLLICLFGIIIFVFLGILPAQKRIGVLDDKLGESRLRLEEQKILMPVYQTLKQKARKDQKQVLPFPVKGILPREKMDLLNSTVKETARRAGVNVAFLPLPLTALAAGSTSLTIELAVKGDFHSFRKFMIGLGAINYIDHIEEIQILEKMDSMEMKIKFSIARS